MDRLPDELVLCILEFVKAEDLAQIQLVCQRLASLGRDDGLWKSKCFESSRFEAARRRRERLAAQEAMLATLRRAMDEAFPAQSMSTSTPLLGDAATWSARERQARARANWDPSWSREKPDYYQEYIHRHGPLSLDWLPAAPCLHPSAQPQEAVGLGILVGHDGVADRAIAPLDDGSICVWNVAPQDAHSTRRGSIVARTQSPLLSATSGSGGDVLNETGAVDNVSVDSVQKKAYFAIHNELSEIDLNTLQVINRRTFSFPITCLSPARHTTPLTVGTSMTLHLHDQRRNQPQASLHAPSTCELIGGLPWGTERDHSKDELSLRSHAVLPQPGPLSILHIDSSTSQDIWVGGRFKTLLHYDRRCWPRIQGTIFSGARTSSLCYLPNSYIPRELNIVRNETLSIADLDIAKSMPGATLVTAGEYRGKGSLELYDLSRPADRAMLPPHLSTMWELDSSYRNRQTASKSRLLSVAPHGSRYVFSDGDGNLKWVERDVSSAVREFNINNGSTEAPDQASLFASRNEGNGDIVQKIIPIRGSACGETNRDDLLIWTGDGRVGLVGFRKGSTRGVDRNADEQSSVEDEGAAYEERMYEQRMRRALEIQADETRFVRGLGFPRSM